MTLSSSKLVHEFETMKKRGMIAGLTFEERFALLVDQEWTWRQNRALARRLTQAKFRVTLVCLAYAFLLLERQRFKRNFSFDSDSA